MILSSWVVGLLIIVMPRRKERPTNLEKWWIMVFMPQNWGHIIMRLLDPFWEWLSFHEISVEVAAKFQIFPESTRPVPKAVLRHWSNTWIDPSWAEFLYFQHCWGWGCMSRGLPETCHPAEPWRWPPPCDKMASACDPSVAIVVGRPCCILYI